MLAKVQSCAVMGLAAVPIEVEVDIQAQGLPNFTIVGLPDKAVEEARERVRAAIKNSGAEFPAKRITINLAPSDLPKEGTHYDVPIAIGILLASGQFSADISNALFLGELSLNGAIRGVTGVLPMLAVAQQLQLTHAYVPAENAQEAAVIPALLKTNGTTHTAIYATHTIHELAKHLAAITPLVPYVLDQAFLQPTGTYEVDMADIKGQEAAKRALEVCAAGGHNISMIGTPGSGKTLLAKALRSILPHMTPDEMVEVTKIYSIAGLLTKSIGLVTQRPFRAPHHTVSQIGLIGGGSKPKPGEISLAHRGVLFLDEFPQFPRNCIESLRAPLEDGITTIVRAAQALTFPSKFMLVTAQNPCPCGFYGTPDQGNTPNTCQCTPAQILKYQLKISGPMLDRIDVHITVPKVPNDALFSQATSEPSSVIQQRVQAARDKQIARFEHTSITCNAEMTTPQVKRYCDLDSETQAFFHQAIAAMNVSARSFVRTLKVARTIADLAGSEAVAIEHVAEALQYRPQQRML